MASGKISAGMERKTSTTRMRKASTLPPTIPAVHPTISPMKTAPATTDSDRTRESRAPETTP